MGSGRQWGPKAGQSDVRRELRFDLGFGWGQVRSSLRQLGWYRNVPISPSMCFCGRIAPELQLCRPQHLDPAFCARSPCAP